MSSKKIKLIELTKLLNAIETVGVNEIRDAVGELKYNFSSVKGGSECLVSAYVDVGKVSSDLHLFVMDAIAELKIFEVEKIGSHRQTKYVCFERSMSDNYLDKDKQNEFKSSLEKQVSYALIKEYDKIKYLVKNDELIGDHDPLGKVKSQRNDIIDKMFSGFRSKIDKGLSL